jgi:DnaJ-class molecular chaperone
MRNPYDVLGVSAGASDDDIRAAFRRLAKEHHPDKNPGDAGAEERFKEVNAAYALLSDPVARGRFDRGEIGPDGSPGRRRGRDDGAAPGSGAHPAFDDILSQMFGAQFGGRRRGGRDLRCAVDVSFEDAIRGLALRVVLPDGAAAEVAVPPGVEDGDVVRIAGRGEAGPSGQAGDLLVSVRVAGHRTLRRVGGDVHCEIGVSLQEAILGGKVTVPSAWGPLSVTVPPGSNTGTVLRLKGKGAKGGDQYVTLRVVLPDRVDDELAAFVRGWAERHPYTPRDAA